MKKKLNETTRSGLKPVAVCLKKMNSLNLENSPVTAKPKPANGNGTKSPRTGVLGRPRKYKTGPKKDKAQKRSLESQAESQPEPDYNRGETC